MFNEDIERKLFEDWCYKNCWNINKYPESWENSGEYCDQFVADAWEGWKAAKRNIVPMNTVKHDCRDIPIKVVGAPDISKSQGTELYRKLTEE